MPTPSVSSLLEEDINKAAEWAMQTLQSLREPPLSEAYYSGNVQCTYCKKGGHMWKDCPKREEQATISRPAQLTADGTQLDEIINKKLAAALKSHHLPHSNPSSACKKPVVRNR
jgi:hypothetical protein